MARYSISARTTNAPTTTLPGGSLYSGGTTNPLHIREIGVFNTTATACAISINRLTSAGTQGTGLSESKIGDDAVAAAVGTGFQSHTGTPPTLGDELARVSLGAAVGSGMVWTFDDEAIRVPPGTANGIGILAATGTGQVVDFYVIWDE